MQDIERLVSDLRTAAQTERRERLLDICAEERRTGLVWVGDQLEGEEHGGAEYVERAPVHVARDCQRCVREEVRTGLADQSDKLVRGPNGNIKRVGSLGVFVIFGPSTRGGPCCGW